MAAIRITFQTWLSCDNQVQSMPMLDIARIAMLWDILRRRYIGYNISYTACGVATFFLVIPVHAVSLYAYRTQGLISRVSTRAYKAP